MQVLQVMAALRELHRLVEDVRNEVHGLRRQLEDLREEWATEYTVESSEEEMESAQSAP